MKKLSLDNHKLLYHLDVLNAWARGEEIGPIYMALSPSGCCNLRCIFCAYSYLAPQKPFLGRDVVSSALRDFKAMGVKAVFYSGEGEPFLNRELPAMVSDTHQNGIDVAVNTNGLLFTEPIVKKIVEKFTFVRYSVNAGTSESYKKIHRTHIKAFDTVIGNIACAVRVKNERKAKTTIGVQCLLLQENLGSLLNLAAVLKEIGVDYLAIKPFFKHPRIEFGGGAVLSDCGGTLEEMEAMSTEKFRVIVRRNSFERYAARSYRRCLSLPFMAEIDCRGDVYPCGPYLGFKEFIYGNIHEASFKDIWDGERAREVRKRISTRLDVSKCMPNCRNDAVNRFLWQLKNEPEHVNFI